MEPVDLFSGIDDDDWLDVLLRRKTSSALGNSLIPELPPDSVQLAFNGTVGEANLRNGLAIYQQIKAANNTWGETLTPSMRILDFGCGWGRIIRFFLKDVHAANLFGVDIAPMGINACEITMPGEYRLIEKGPPLEFPGQTFDLVYAWSVFSHLPEDLHIRWIEEFSRILKPGGVLVASTLHRSFIEESRRLKIAGVFSHPWQKAAAESFDDFEAALRDYDEGSFLFSPRPREDYGMAIIPQAYVQRHWTRLLDFCEFVDKPQSLDQSLIVMKKGESPGSDGNVDNFLRGGGN